jgi:YVTN family beta-propeller protein
MKTLVSRLVSPFLGAALTLTCSGGIVPASSAEPNLERVATIQLGDVQGRIDHLAIDLEHGLLFVAELGNGSVSVIDLATGTVRHRITGLAMPQGLAYAPETDTLFVATGRDSQIRIFNVPDMTLQNTVAVGLDPDNVHLQPGGSFVAVGFLSGLAFLDVHGTLLATVPLNGHAEGFQFDPTGERLFVNVPDAAEITAIDVSTRTVTNHWPTKQAAAANFPMTIDGDVILAGFRAPPLLGAYSTDDGAVLSAVQLCRDSDDLFADAGRAVVYAICGDGQILTFARADNGRSYEVVAQVETILGARTGLFVPDLDRLFVAVPAQSGSPASIWVFAPNN